VGWAAKVAREAGIERRIVSTDRDNPVDPIGRVAGGVEWLERPAELCQDETPMIAVVQHALEQVPGPDDQIIVLLQPTQPLRTVAHVHTAIARLREPREMPATSVVSVVQLPATHHGAMQLICQPYAGRMRLRRAERPTAGLDDPSLPTRRQQLEPTYIRDGTVYAFWRRTVTRYGNVYGPESIPLIIPAEESCELDTMADWAALEARLATR